MLHCNKKIRPEAEIHYLLIISACYFDAGLIIFSFYIGLCRNVTCDAALLSTGLGISGGRKAYAARAENERGA
jgi:hypothetical protein